MAAFASNHHSLEPANARLRGRAGVAQRWRRLAAEPLCRDCRSEGLITASTVPDHIVPLALGGKDTDDNIRCLCEVCHKKRTREQFGFKRIGVDANGWPLDRSHPWNGGDGRLSAEAKERRMPTNIKPSAIPMTMVCGPPGSGKSTYIRDHASDGDITIDLDRIMSSMSGLPEHHTDSRWLEPALDERNRQLRALATDTKHTKAWFIIAAPDPRERATWAKRLGAEVVVMDTPLDECIRRINADPTRQGHVDRMVHAAKNWWSQQA